VFLICFFYSFVFYSCFSLFFVSVPKLDDGPRPKFVGRITHTWKELRLNFSEPIEGGAFYDIYAVFGKKLTP